eukprot:GHVQ01003020.1.p1 GENE.GHVQ01003020.1~~GHVQ01003020.1.p1  ORF type:complete len:1310 (-),score=195.67 GHVQ01003020.1:1977-5906(-)
MQSQEICQRGVREERALLAGRSTTQTRSKRPPSAVATRKSECRKRGLSGGSKQAPTGSLVNDASLGSTTYNLEGSPSDSRWASHSGACGSNEVCSGSLKREAEGRRCEEKRQYRNETGRPTLSMDNEKKEEMLSSLLRQCSLALLRQCSLRSSTPCPTTTPNISQQKRGAAGEASASDQTGWFREQVADTSDNAADDASASAHVEAGEEEYRVIYRRFQALAFTPGGFLTDRLRQRIWPILLGLPVPLLFRTEPTTAGMTTERMSHTITQNEGVPNRDDYRNYADRYFAFFDDSPLRILSGSTTPGNELPSSSGVGETGSGHFSSSNKYGNAEWFTWFDELLATCDTTDLFRNDARSQSADVVDGRPIRSGKQEFGDMSGNESTAIRSRSKVTADTLTNKSRDEGRGCSELSARRQICESCYFCYYHGFLRHEEYSANEVYPGMPTSDSESTSDGVDCYLRCNCTASQEVKPAAGSQPAVTKQQLSGTKGIRRRRPRASVDSARCSNPAEGSPPGEVSKETARVVEVVARVSCQHNDTAVDEDIDVDRSVAMCRPFNQGEQIMKDVHRGFSTWLEHAELFDEGILAVTAPAASATSTVSAASGASTDSVAAAASVVSAASVPSAAHCGVAAPAPSVAPVFRQGGAQGGVVESPRRLTDTVTTRDRLSNMLSSQLTAFMSRHTNKLSYAQGLHDVFSVFVHVCFNLQEYQKCLCDDGGTAKGQEGANALKTPVSSSPGDYDGIYSDVGTDEPWSFDCKWLLPLLLPNLCFCMCERFSLFFACDFLAAPLERSLLPVLRLLGVLLRHISPRLHAVFSALPGATSCPGSEFHFALSWILTWFAHDMKYARNVVRLFDCFLASHPLFVVYVAAAVIARKESEVVRTFERMSGASVSTSGHIYYGGSQQAKLNEESELWQIFLYAEIHMLFQDMRWNDADVEDLIHSAHSYMEGGDRGGIAPDMLLREAASGGIEFAPFSPYRFYPHEWFLRGHPVSLSYPFHFLCNRQSTDFGEIGGNDDRPTQSPTMYPPIPTTRTHSRQELLLPQPPSGSGTWGRTVAPCCLPLRGNYYYLGGSDSAVTTILPIPMTRPQHPRPSTDNSKSQIRAGGVPACVAQAPNTRVELAEGYPVSTTVGSATRLSVCNLIGGASRGSTWLDKFRQGYTPPVYMYVPRGGESPGLGTRGWELAPYEYFCPFCSGDSYGREGKAHVVISSVDYQKPHQIFHSERPMVFHREDHQRMLKRRYEWYKERNHPFHLATTCHMHETARMPRTTTAATARTMGIVVRVACSLFIFFLGWEVFRFVFGGSHRRYW